MVKKILVPTDGSEASDNALEYAIERAKMSNSELLILNVIRTGIVKTLLYEIQSKNEYGHDLRKKLEDELEGRAKKIVNQAIERAKGQGIDAEGVVRRGLPDKEIITLAKERDDVELIVMGAYGRDFLERQMVGSRTEGVLRALPGIKKPLVIVPKSAEDIKTGGGWILVPTDGSEASDQALEYAIKRAKMSNSNILVLYVITTGTPTSFFGVSIKKKLLAEQDEGAKRIAARSVNRAKTQGVNAEGLVRRGMPDREIIALAKELEDVELIVMGAYGKNFLERQLVGSKTEAVLRAIPEIDKPLVVYPSSS
jgi:nucleotide-binding universal stress UspA family protein